MDEIGHAAGGIMFLFIIIGGVILGLAKLGNIYYDRLARKEKSGR